MHETKRLDGTYQQALGTLQGIINGVEYYSTENKLFQESILGYANSEVIFCTKQEFYTELKKAAIALDKTSSTEII